MRCLVTPVWRFAIPAKAELPFHRFAKGDTVVLSAKFRCDRGTSACHVIVAFRALRFCGGQQ